MTAAEMVERNLSDTRMSVTFEGEALKMILQMSEDEGLDVEDIVRTAVGLRKWTKEKQDEEAIIIARWKNGEERELVF